MRFSHRLDPLPEYLTARLNRLAEERRASGREVITLGVGDPDLPPPQWARDLLAETVRGPDVAGYPTNRGLRPLREAVARFYARRFGVDIDPEREVLPLLGAKEGIAHLALAQLDAGDAALIADPGYPVYVGGPTLAGADPVPLPLLAANDFQPDLAAVPEAVRRRANLLVLGYPNNPTGAMAGPGLFAVLRDFGVPICHDNAYSEITFDGQVAPSFLATEGARESGIEILSLSKAFSLPGWRIAFAVGNAAMIGNLHRLKTNVDAGMFPALQHVAIALLDSDPEERRALARTYQERRDVVCDALEAAGVPIRRPQGAMYVWMPVPAGDTSVAFAERLLEDAGVLVAPGSAYGAAGEGFVRISLTQPQERLATAMRQLVNTL
jgi:LL-diaminopimelate aminotransferase